MADKETNDLGLYIERNQKELLSDLIGDVVYNRYLADSSQSKFKVLTEGLNGDESQFWYYDNSDVVINYYGLKEALKYFTYWDYVRNLNAKPTSVGIRFADAENSSGSTQLQVNSVIEQRYNLGVEAYMEAANMLSKVCDSKLHYTGIAEDGTTAGLYEILIFQKYEKNSLNYCSLLDAGDSIELDGIDYEIDSVDLSVANECRIQFQATTGLTFEDKYFYIDPYLDYRTKPRNISVLDGFL